MRVVIVDAGNYSRTPAAEVLLKEALARRGLGDRIAVGSAGLKDKHAGSPPDPRTKRWIEGQARGGRDLSLEDFRCRQIGPSDYGADLVLAMDRATLRELEARAPEGTRLDLYLIASRDDVIDPYYGDDAGFDRVMEQIDRGASELADHLAQEIERAA